MTVPPSMNRRELVKAAIAHRETERVPYCIEFTAEAEANLCREHGVPSAKAFADNDIIQVGVSWWGWRDLESDWSQPEVPTSRPKTRAYGCYDTFYDNLKALRDNSDKYILLMIVGSHWEMANRARGIENFLADLAGEPAFAQRLLNHIIDKNMAMLEDLLWAEEIDGVLLGSDWGTQVDLIMSPSTWEDMIRPGEQREYDLIHGHGRDVWVHSCGNIERVIPSLVEMGVDVLNPIQPEAMDIEMLKKDFGDKLTFWGGISTQQSLPFGTPEEVRRETRDVRAMMSKGGGFVLGSGQSVQGDVPVENMVTLVETAKEASPCGA